MPEQINTATQESVRKWIPEFLAEKYTFYSYNHAVEILSQSFPGQFQELSQTLEQIEITRQDILQLGGNESPIPPKFNALLNPLGWKEMRISGDLLIKFYPRRGEKKGVFSPEPSDQKILRNYIDGHNIDFVKDRIAVDVEWNSKDQTFDRDLYAMRTYFECDIISVGIIITRDESLNTLFRKLNLMQKYGASTTWLGKLLPRLDSRRHGGCPILAVGITPRCIKDIDDEI